MESKNPNGTWNTSKIVAKLSALDTDKSGDFDIQELSTVLEKLSIETTDDELSTMFSRFDSDNSGRLDFIEIANALEDLADRAAKEGAVDEALQLLRITLVLLLIFLLLGSLTMHELSFEAGLNWEYVDCIYFMVIRYCMLFQPSPFFCH